MISIAVRSITALRRYYIYYNIGFNIVKKERKKDAFNQKSEINIDK